MSAPEFQRFSEFYPYYLGEHQHPLCRALHYCGSTLVLVTWERIVVNCYLNVATAFISGH